MNERSLRPIKIVKRGHNSENKPVITDPSESVEQKMTAADHVKASQEVLRSRRQADSEFLEQWRSRAA